MTTKKSIIAALLVAAPFVFAGTPGRIAQYKTATTLQNGPATMLNRQISFTVDGGGTVSVVIFCMMSRSDLSRNRRRRVSSS